MKQLNKCNQMLPRFGEIENRVDKIEHELKNKEEGLREVANGARSGTGEYPVIFTSGDDMRQDQLVIQLFPSWIGC